MPTSLPTIKQLAKNVTVQASVWGQIPVPLERIADSLGFGAVTFDGDDDTAGAIRYDRRTIYINKHDATVRQRFTLAHEIGHAVLHKDEDLIDYRRNMSSRTDPKEVEANRFAAELLMPEDAFRAAWRARGGDTIRVAVYFGVSEEAARYRAENIGL